MKAKRSSLTRTERVRLYPTSAQVAVFERTLGACCDLYNAGLAERRGAYEAWKRTKPADFAWPTVTSQTAQFVELRSDWAWIDAVYAESMRDSLHRLDLAFSAFFRRHKAGENPGYPRFRSKRRFDTFAYPHGMRAVRVFEKTLKLPAPIGSVKYRVSGRALPERFGVVKITRNCGKWYACFEHVIEQKQLAPTGRLIGIDVGIANFAATSDGELVPNPRFANAARATVELHQQAVSRCKKRSKRRRKAILLLATAKQREAAQRIDHAHKLSRSLVNACDLIAFEDLRVPNMVRSAKGTAETPGTNVAQKAGLNRSIQDAAWRRFTNFVSYKAEEAGRRVVFVDPKNTSRTCASCGYVAAENRLEQAVFLCVRCGHLAHADVNAAINIRERARLGLASAA